MQPPPPFGYQQIVTELIRGVLDTVADKPGLSPARKAAAQQTVVCSVMSYNPRDAIEVMLAGQCIVYDAVLRDGARDMLRGQSELIKISARPSILAAGKMFLETTRMVVRMQGRAADLLAFARQEEVPAPEPEPKGEEPDAPEEQEEAPIAAAPPPPEVPEQAASPPRGVPRPATGGLWHPSPEEEKSTRESVSRALDEFEAARAMHQTTAPPRGGTLFPPEYPARPDHGDASAPSGTIIPPGSVRNS